MSAMSRTKGKVGERELANLIADSTGWNARRRVRQNDGDSDIEGIPGWSVEVKRHKTAKASEIAAWWAQAVTQANGSLPVLFYRLDRAEWRAVWPLAVLLTRQQSAMWKGIEWTATTSVEAWAAAARDFSAVGAVGALEGQPA